MTAATTSAEHGAELAEEVRGGLLRRGHWVLVAGYAAVLAGLGLVGVAALQPGWPAPQLQIPWPVIVLGFLVAEGTALHVEIRKESHSLSLSGFVLALGVMTLNPLALVGARVLGSGFALAVIRRRTGMKLVWNLSLFGAETALVALVALPAVRDGLVDEPGEMVLLLAAVLLAELLGLVAVPLVIYVSGGELRASIIGQVARGQLVAGVSSTYAVVVVLAGLHLRSAAVLGLIPVLGASYLLHRHGQLGKEHHDLQRLHGFAEAISGPDSLDAGLRELSSILRVRGAALAVVDDAGGHRIRLWIEDRFDNLHLPAETSTGHQVRPMDALTERLLSSIGARRGEALAVQASSDEPATLIVFDRLGATDRLGADERRLFDSMASVFGARLSAEQLLDRLERQATTDPLTGLCNRAGFEEALAASATDELGAGAVAVFDIESFKEINDSFGPDVGDSILVALGRRLLDETRTTDTVARLGGDEFAVVFGDGEATVFAGRIAHLAAQLARPTIVGDLTLEVGVKVGFSDWQQEPVVGPELIRRAEVALNEAKRTRQRCVAYSESIDQADADAMTLRGQLRAAIETGQIVVFLQPQHRSGDLTLVGAEALARWDHPEMGIIGPNRFVPLAEGSDLGGELTRCVFEGALAAAARLQSEGMPLSVSVNLTSGDLLDPTLPHLVSASAALAGVDPARLTFEVTETSLITDLDAAVETLAALQRLGCRTSADDFGTGYASLQYLQQLPLDEVKIDRSFVAGAAANAGDEAIVRSTTQLLHDLGLEVVAEGVEDTITSDLVGRAGCDVLQGYLFAKPLPIGEFVDYAAERLAPVSRQEPVGPTG